MRKFNPKAFSLNINIKGQEPREIEIPVEREIKTIEGPDLQTEKLTRTTQWLIDKYTTKFASEEELLEDIKANKRANLEGISDAYSDSFDLINLLDTSDSFNDRTGMLYGEYAKIFVENFKRYMIEKTCLHGEAFDYFEYMEDHIKNPRFYSRKLLTGLLLQYDKEEYAQGNYHLNNRAFEEEFEQYYNVRAHCLINQDDLNAVLHLTRIEKRGHPTNAEEALDLKQAKEEAKIHHKKRSIDEIQYEFLGDKMIRYPKKTNTNYDNVEFLQDPEEEMERYNHYYDDKPTEPINKEHETNIKTIMTTYYDDHGQGILPIEDAHEKATDIVYYNEENQQLLFNPEDYGDKPHQKR